MSTKVEPDLEKLGRDAAEFVAGAGVVKQVEVTRGEDEFDRPVYFFSFLIDQARAAQRAGLLRTRLVQRLRDDLIAQGDAHFPIIEILNKDDWVKRAHAKSH